MKENAPPHDAQWLRKEQECRNPHVERAAKLSGGPQIVPSAIENAVNRGVQLAVGLAPNTHFVILAQSVLFRGAGFSVVWPQLLALLTIGTLLFLFSLRRFRQFLR
ncbi:ABC transporter permease (plasmid) [Brucella anthropi]|uniref:ABC transporter permease n=1 Tax=Brucella TaxID=234 RepID=UPI000466320E|nr:MULTISPECIES: ABC transporter permease [Brucella]KAB2730998.1 ABC transporter permease [Brucella anthropi]QQC28812.1 ABC transporter permease [Brucella anthropi]SUB56179.1 Inner membrane transport permease yhhJ [Brucella anthropi]